MKGWIGKGGAPLLNGTSGAGKSTLAEALRTKLEPQFVTTHLINSQVQAFASWNRPFVGQRDKDSSTDFTDQYPRLRSPVLTSSWSTLSRKNRGLTNSHRFLAPFDIFWAAVHAPLADLERRDRIRSHRQIGEAAYHLKLTLAASKLTLAAGMRWKSIRGNHSFKMSGHCGGLDQTPREGR